MALVALLSAHHSTGDGTEAWGSLVVGGLPIVARQVRQASLAGVRRAIVKVESASPTSVAALQHLGPDVVIARDGGELAAAIGSDDVLLFAEGLVIGDDLVRQMVDLDGLALAVWTGEAPAEAERIDHQSCWAGLARIPGAVVVETALGLDDWDMQSTLLRVTSALAPARLAIDAPDPVGGIAVPSIVWCTVRSAESAQDLTAQLLQATRSSGGNWALQYLHTPVALWLTRLLLPTRVSPTTIRVAGTTIGLAATVALAMGWLMVGVSFVIVSGFLPVIANKMAQVRLEAVPHLDIWNLTDQLIGYGWLVGLAGWLAQSNLSGSPWLLAGIVIAFSVASTRQTIHFYHLTGRHFSDCGVWERRLGRLAADPDPLIWVLLPFLWFANGLTGLAALAGYACLIFFLTQARVFVALRGFIRLTET